MYDAYRSHEQARTSQNPSTAEAQAVSKPADAAEFGSPLPLVAGFLAYVAAFPAIGAVVMLTSGGF